MRMRFKPYAHDELMAADFHVHEPLIWGGKWHAQYAKSLDARCVNHPAAIRQRKHLAERSSVHSRVVGVGNLRRPQFRTRHNEVEHGALPHSTVTAEERYLVFQQRQQAVHALFRFCRHFQTVIPHRFIQRNHHVEIAALVVLQQVHLVEHKCHRHGISLGRGKETVDEGG